MTKATDMVFVFGSNLAGRHGKGAAKTAATFYGAEYGVGVGPTGRSYAIPTKDANLQPLDLPTIAKYVEEFIDYANNNPNEIFKVTSIGCGLAGYTPEQIAPMFLHAPMNCYMSEDFENIIWALTYE